MTAYIKCVECNGGVPHYYAWLYGPDAMHPGCAIDRIDEEGCGATWFHLSQNSIQTKTCPSCHGEGRDDHGDHWRYCKKCNGSGEVVDQ